MTTVLATLDGQPILLAQDVTSTEGDTTETTTDADGGDDGGGGGSPFGGGFMFIIFGMIILWIFLLGGGSRKQKKKQAEMLASISKGSKVVSIGGIKGSVVEVREDEIVVKVDENNNTRMKFSRDAIRSVLDDNAGKDGDAKKNDKADKDKDKK